jgi:hypothetical protein
MKFFNNNWRLIFHLLMPFVVVPSALWWLDNRVQFLTLPFGYYIFAGFALWIGAILLFEYLQYLRRGYFMYQDHGNNLVYKERGNGNLDFGVHLRYDDEQYGGVVVHVLSDDKWREEMPEWAKERKEIIVQRLKKDYYEVDNVQIVEY